MDGKEQPRKWPNTVAFQDEFTRKFLVSTKEVKDGYYLFKSKTGGYTMWFPKDAKIDHMFYERHKKYYESIHLGGGREDEHIDDYVRVTYEDAKITENIDVNLELLSTYVHYEGKYKKFNSSDNAIYFGKNKQTLSSKGSDEIYYFFGYIKSNHSHQAVRFIYAVKCKDVKHQCGINMEQEEERAKMLMKSIKFHP
ncbi:MULTISPECIES: hypothetical protein [Geobacillus]|uniref:Lipoprotein YvcA n=1 Tax=Geobacillus subterraneus TaxID=129338 RepID=A0A679FMD7_9BACL|nr:MULTISPECIES: hypothetical protein [Geobacillus]KYD27799.1 hypothetical protein B4113_0033 [Geobacillus sp. B4113_201601]BBW97548.1 hypothetical protein GsuE55_23810 [Geobacillus subterraneus]